MNPKPLLIVAVLVAAAAAVHGAVTRRWSTFDPDPAQAERMHALAVRFRDCEPTDLPYDEPLKEKSVATSKRYGRPGGNFSAVVSVISGVPGAVSTHTPDVCYVGSGYRMSNGPRRETVDLPGGGTAAYLVADFEKPTAAGADRQRVRWAWSADGTWDAPEWARFRYMRVPTLYKLYIVTPVPDPGADLPAADTDAARAFTAAAFAQYAAALGR